MTERFRFGPYEANAKTRELRKDGLRIQLEEKPFEVLALLLEQPGALVTREELRHRLWPNGTFVDFDNSLNSAVNRLREALRDDARRPKYIETLPRRGYRFIAPVEPVRMGRPTLAVLPFENLSGDPGQDFLADALADALTTELGNVTSLRVISRQSVLHLKGTRKTLPEIARDLKADLVIEGSVVMATSSIRIAAQVVQATPEQHLWARAYTCEMSDILAMQGKIARDVALALQVTLSSAESALLSRPRPVNPEAHVAYLKARHHMGQNSREGFQKGFQYLQSALEKDPSHVPALTRLAECYSLLGYWGHMPIGEAYSRAKEAALRAVALDDGLSTAHWVLGWVSWLHDWDLAICEAETCRAIQMNPSDEGARVVYAVFLAVLRRDPQAAAEAQIALNLDPLSLHVNTSAAWVRLFLRDCEGALQQAHAALELFPDSLQAYYVMGCAQLGLCRFPEAVHAFERAFAISPDALSTGYLGHALARAGQMEAATALRNELESKVEGEYVTPKGLLVLYAGLGERNLAFNELERMYRHHDALLFWLCAVPPITEQLHSDLRFVEMAHRIGLRRD